MSEAPRRDDDESRSATVETPDTKISFVSWDRPLVPDEPDAERKPT